MPAPLSCGSPCPRTSRSDRFRRHLCLGGESPPRLVNSTSPSKCSASSWTRWSQRSPGPPLTAASVRGQFQDFDLSLGQLPESGKLVFNALQTYSSGEKVNWNEVSADPSVEPEHPAPILTITPAAADEAAAPTDTGSQDEQVASAPERHCVGLNLAARRFGRRIGAFSGRPSARVASEPASVAGRRGSVRADP